MLMCQVIMPTGSTLEQTQAVADQVARHFLENEKEAVESCMTISGIGFSGRSQNNGMVFVKLKDWELRERPDLKAKAVAGRAMGAFSSIRNAMVFAFPPPAVVELGNARGVDFQLMDRGGLGHDGPDERPQPTPRHGQRRTRGWSNVRPNGMEDVPEFRVDVDWDEAGAQGVPISSIHTTISAAFGSAYVNDFIQGGRVKRVYVQADAPYRMLPKDLEKLYVRNTAGKMVPYASFASNRWTSQFPPAGTLQRLSLDEHLGRAGAGPKFRRGHAGHGGDRREAARRHRLRLDRALLPGTDGDGPGADPLRLLHPGDLPLRRRAVRKLDHPLRQPA